MRGYLAVSGLLPDTASLSIIRDPLKVENEMLLVNLPLVVIVNTICFLLVS